MFEKIDEQYEEGNVEQTYIDLKKLYDSNPKLQKDPELLWRFGRACHSCAARLLHKDPKKKALLVEGQKYAVDAAILDEKNFDNVKWAAVCSGALAELLGVKERIEMGNVFKGYLDKALIMNPSEFSLLHMRGRYSYSVANLSWLERKIASSFFGNPPEATFDDAIKDFLEVEKIKNGTWINNLLYLAKSYLANKNKAEAVKYLKKAASIQSDDDGDKEVLSEVTELLKKNDK